MSQIEFTSSNIFKNKFVALIATLVAAFAAGMAGLLDIDPLILLGGVAALYIVMLLFRWPDFTVVFVTFIIYTNTATILTKFHGFPRPLAYVLPLLLLIPFIWQIFVKRQGIKVNFVFLLMVVYFSIMVIGSAFSRDVDRSIPNVINFLAEGLGLYFLLINSIRTPRLLNRVVWSLLIAGGLIGALSLYQQVTGTFDNPYWGFAQVTGRGFTAEETLQGEVRQARVSGPIGEKNRYAQVMLMLVPLGLFRAWGEPSRKLRLAAIALTGLIFIGASLAFSRGAMVGFLMLIAIMTVMRYIKLRQVLVILLGIVLLVVAFPQINVRFSSLSAIFSSEEEGGLQTADGAIRGRATEMLVALYVFLDHPVFGVGPGMLGLEMAEYSREIAIRNIIATREAHSLYLGEAAEVGAMGLVTLMVIFFYTLQRLAKARTYWLEINNQNMANLCTGFSLAVISYMTTAVFLHMSYLRYLWLIMALAAIAAEFRAADVTEDMEVPDSKDRLVPAESPA
ncbi:MAG: O-antigen ligase family protein [Chloroflexota bacterium]|nr:O-antigen ligase family protein [Chloroflexota bacterium]